MGSVLTPARSQLLGRVRGVLPCPSCRQPLQGPAAGETGPFVCPACGPAGAAAATRFRFGGLVPEDEKADWLNALKARAKRRLGSYYPAAIRALSPVYGLPWTRRFLGTF